MTRHLHSIDRQNRVCDLASFAVYAGFSNASERFDSTPEKILRSEADISRAYSTAFRRNLPKVK